MKALFVIGAVLAFLASLLLLRIVLHGYTDHGHLDLFHLVVGIVSAGVGGVLLQRAYRRHAP